MSGAVVPLSAAPSVAAEGAPATPVYSFIGALNFLMLHSCYFPHDPIHPNFKD